MSEDRRPIRPITARQAERILGHRIDRRRSYAFDPEPDKSISDCHVLELVRWVSACSGCYEGYRTDGARGNGCHECGYHGRVRHAQWVPYVRDEYAKEQAKHTEKAG